MRKTLQDLASYLKDILVTEMHEPYAINPVFTEGFVEVDIREGVPAFRAFLERMYDAIYTSGTTYDQSKKVAHAYENRTTLSVYFPFLHHVKNMLMNIGYHGVVTEGALALPCGSTIFNKKLSLKKNLECLQFLMACGIAFEGIDLNDKNVNFYEIKNIKISYLDNPVMLIGMKIMAIAEIDHGTLVNQDVFLRCDYRILKQEKSDVLDIVKDTINPLSSEVQDFVLHLHQRYTGKGLTCVVEIKGFHVYIKYAYKRKDLWGINASLNNGFHINVKSKRTHEYMDTINTFSPYLQNLIAKGYGCGRKRSIGRCDGGCRGMPIPLDSSILDLRKDIIAWFDQELLSI